MENVLGDLSRLLSQQFSLWFAIDSAVMKGESDRFSMDFNKKLKVAYSRKN